MLLDTADFATITTQFSTITPASTAIPAQVRTALLLTAIGQRLFDEAGSSASMGGLAAFLTANTAALGATVIANTTASGAVSTAVQNAITAIVTELNGYLAQATGNPTAIAAQGYRLKLNAAAQAVTIAGST